MNERAEQLTCPLNILATSRKNASSDLVVARFIGRAGIASSSFWSSLHFLSLCRMETVQILIEAACEGGYTA